MIYAMLIINRRDLQGRTILPPIGCEKTHTLTHTLLLGYNFGLELHFGAKNCGVVWDGAVKFWGFVIFWVISGGLTGMI